MKKIYKYLTVSVLVVTVVIGFTVRSAVHAASTPSLGAAATYGVLANTYTNSGAATTTVNGDVGFTVAPTIAPSGTHTNYGSGSPYATAGTDQATALAALNNQACTFTWNAAVDLFLDATHGTPGAYTPGVYCSVGAMNVTGSLTLNGSGTYIFRATGALGTTAGIGINLAGGASVCDVFWTPHATTLGAGTNFAGTLIDDDAVTVGASTVWTGRALAFNGPVTTGASSTITAPTCAPPLATLHVIKQVVNNSGGTATVSSFSLHVKLAGVDVSGSPEPGAGAPGTSYSLAAGTYDVSEDANAGYAATFSGDCNSSGSVTLASSDDKTCTITNDDIAVPVPPLIDVVKVPSPLTLPSGPGTVTYTYAVSNTGTVTMSNVILTDDKCAPVTFVSGDTNSDSSLDTSEVWTYQCTTTLSQTTTNTATASGQANGFTATDTAQATVVVSTPLPAPLIHIVKIPSTLVVTAGGSVTYTYTVTNPGTADLSNVGVVDDKCSPVSGPSGDTNNNSILEASETWTYTCQMNLTATTTNTATTEGSANSLTATDSSIVTVVVTPPGVAIPANVTPPPTATTQQEETVIIGK